MAQDTLTLTRESAIQIYGPTRGPKIFEEGLKKLSALKGQNFTVEQYQVAIDLLDNKSVGSSSVRALPVFMDYFRRKPKVGTTARQDLAERQREAASNGRHDPPKRPRV